MSYFLADRPLAEGLEFTFAGEEAQHLLASRRTRSGERFAVQDPDGRRFLAEVLRAGRREAAVRVVAPLALPEPPPVAVTLLQAAVKEKALELIVQKATELGVVAIRVFPAEHGTVPHRVLGGDKAIDRWHRIAWEACKQSDRPAPPALHALPHLAAALADEAGAASTGAAAGVAPAAPPPLRLVLEPTGDVTLGRALAEAAAAAVHLLVGPEGGLSAGEVAQAEAAGFRPVRLGGTTLRAETAAIAACAVALYGGR